MKNIIELNDNELINICGGQETVVDYEHKWYDNEEPIAMDCCMFGAPAIIK